MPVREFSGICVSVLNQRYGIDVGLDVVEGSNLLPSIDKYNLSIKFNYRLACLFSLFQAGNPDLIIKYFMMHKYMAYNIYDKAEKWMFEFGKSVGECTRPNDDSITYQILFVLLHEYSHGLFSKNEERRSTYFNQVRKNISELQKSDSGDVRKAITKEVPCILRCIIRILGYDEMIRKNLDHLNEILINEKKTEEFACDLHAWNVLMEFLHHGGYSLKESAAISRYAVEALYYLESYKLLDDCLSQKIDMTKAEAVASFDSCRYSLLAYHILLYFEKEQKGLGLQFDGQFSICQWNNQSPLIRMVSKYIYQTLDLAEGASFPDSKRQKQLYAKICELEKFIIDTDNESVH